ncbi:MAG: hypothetical protein ACLFV5_11625 [Anaerolineales bacterium]
MTDPLVGLIANPAAGKDMRRLVAHASTVGNQSKIGSIRRILVGLGAMGVRRVLDMPERLHLGEQGYENLDAEEMCPWWRIWKCPSRMEPRTRNGRPPFCIERVLAASSSLEATAHCARSLKE